MREEFFAAHAQRDEGQAQRERDPGHEDADGDQRRVTHARRLTCGHLLPTRSLFVPNGGVTADAHRQATRTAAVHRRPPEAGRRQPQLRRDARGARPQVEVGRAPAHFGARGARLHPPSAEPGARAGGAQAPGERPSATVTPIRPVAPAAANDTLEIPLHGRIAAGTPIEALQGTGELRGAGRAARRRASIMRSRSPAIRWSRKEFSTATSR